MEPEMREALLRNVVTLLERAALTPGGQNVKIATENLNNYFKSNPDSDFQLPDATRAYLEEQLAETSFRASDFETRAFEQKDARHIEDCLLYHNIAARVAGPGSMLDRVNRLFEWTVYNVQLVPPEGPMPEALVAQGINPVPARPYDVIIRGFGSEIPGDLWADRSWTFMALCRQIGVDVAMLGYPVADAEEPYYWTCAALIDGTPYLFDTRIGMAIPGPDGPGIATLEQAATEPIVLDRLDLPAPAIPYATEAAALGTVRVSIDSSRGYFAPKMRLLQNDLAGANRMVLHRDPVEQRDAWASALGDRLDAVELWELPLDVEYALFNDPSYVRAIQFVNFYFSPDFPLLGARLRQLRGDLAEAKQDFTRARFRRVDAMAEAAPIPADLRREIQQSIDLFSTYFLGLAQLDDAMPDQAINLFEQALKLPPTEARAIRGRPATLLRLGADSNLGILYEARGEDERAIFAYSRSNTTPQSVSNLLRANALVFDDPFGPPPPPFDPLAVESSETEPAPGPEGGDAADAGDAAAADTP
jgi:tetratricopeptide (TPR) repeat protein